jgi:hypothetical protein
METSLVLTPRARKSGGTLSRVFSVTFSDNNFIGGPQVGLRNVISGNKQQGILFENSTGNRMENNNIGFGANRALFSLVNLGNGSHGIQFDANSKNNIRKNTYAAFNAGSSYKNDGGATNKQIDPNSDHSNAYGIDNGGQAGMPVLSSAIVNGTTMAITGTLSHEANSQYTLEFFGNEVAERQGKGFLGDVTVTTDSLGLASFNTTLNAVYGSYATATSTGLGIDGFTSEFALDIPIENLSTTAAVGNRVWVDLDGNGLQDAGEPGIADALVELFSAEDVFVDSDLSAGDGSYLFSNLAAGEYYLRFTPPVGYVFARPYMGDEIFDSDADPYGGKTAVFSLSAGQVDPTFDAGLFAGQWASSVIDFSSQYSDSLWAATQALGEPDTFIYDDQPTAWAPFPQNSDPELGYDRFEDITVGFSNPVYATGVTVRETFGNGFVYRIDLIEPNGTPHTIWTGVDPSVPESPADFILNFDPTTYLVSAVKIYVDIDLNSDWEEIDAVLLHGDSSGIPLSTQILDDGESGFTATGGFAPYPGQGYQGDVTLAAAGTGSETATWTFTVIPGVYRVAATWFPDANRATNSPFTIFDGTSALATVLVNQQLAPDGFIAAGATWQYLGGTYTISGTTLVVQLSNDANEYVIADGIRIERVGEGGSGFAGSGLAESGMADAFAAAAPRAFSVAHPNRGPFARFTVIGPARVNAPVTFVFNNPVASGYRYSFDFNNDGDFTDPGEIGSSTTPLRTFTFTRRGWTVIHGRIVDASGDYNDFWTKVFVDL